VDYPLRRWRRAFSTRSPSSGVHVPMTLVPAGAARAPRFERPRLRPRSDSRPQRLPHVDEAQRAFPRRACARAATSARQPGPTRRFHVQQQISREYLGYITPASAARRRAERRWRWRIPKRIARASLGATQSSSSRDMHRSSQTARSREKRVSKESRTFTPFAHDLTPAWASFPRSRSYRYSRSSVVGILGDVC
jgi:hypothetical protein